MHLVFLDDASQNPSRERMGPLVAIGGCSLPAENARAAEAGLDELCKEFRFPPGQLFKWSPGKEHWMRDNLTQDARQGFFLRVLSILQASGATVMIAVCDKNHKTATNAESHEADVVNLLFERLQRHLKGKNCDGLVIADRPGGGSQDFERFLLGCLEMRQEGAGYVIPERICVNVVSSPSKFIRLLQAADLVVSSTLARVAGERKYSPPIFQALQSMLYGDANPSRVGGMGLKLHPDYLYANLYHWIGGDKVFFRSGMGQPLPLLDLPYPQDEFHWELDLMKRSA